MPIYDYACSACGRVTEVIHGINEAAPRFCPACGAEGTLRKGFAAPAVHFKGSGWAKKDRKATSSPGKRPDAKTGTDTANSGSASTANADSASASAPAADPAPSKASDD